jgi:hypothetical protein
LEEIMRNHKLHQIETYYNPENDTIREGPLVTWAEKALFDEMLHLMERVTDLETCYIISPDSPIRPRAVKNEALLTVTDLARILINEDYDKVCRLSCGKDEWGAWIDGIGNHKHAEGCPFAIAYEILTPDQSLGIDAAVRTIAKSGKNHDRSPNWRIGWEDTEISATFGSGTNSASVHLVDTGEIYWADDYGKHIRVFRFGPWVQRLITHAEEIRTTNKLQLDETARAEAEKETEKFEEIDF